MHLDYCDMSSEQTKKEFLAFGVEKICGAVITKNIGELQDFSPIKELNDEALYLKDLYQGLYIPGFHVHPAFVKDSISEIERMRKLGVYLIGELCPYLQNWSDYADKNFWEILEVADHYKMMVSFHSSGNSETLFQMDKTIKRFKNIIFVGAHPSSGVEFKAHERRLSTYENYYVDISGEGVNRMGTLRHLITEYGKERILFGSDYPICNLAAYIGGVAMDRSITEDEKEYIFFKNAERLLSMQ